MLVIDQFPTESAGKPSNSTLVAWRGSSKSIFELFSLCRWAGIVHEIPCFRLEILCAPRFLPFSCDPRER
jgi:hypothetical protein